MFIVFVMFVMFILLIKCVQGGHIFALCKLTLVMDSPLQQSIIQHLSSHYYWQPRFFLYMDHSSQIHQICVKSKNFKSLKYSPFDSLIENRKFLKFQLHNPRRLDFMPILRIFAAEFEDKISFEAFSGYL